jgi:hypothetical protein
MKSQGVVRRRVCGQEIVGMRRAKKKGTRGW